MKLSTLVLSFVLWVQVAASAERAVEQVRATADKIIALLSDPKLQGEANRSEKVRLIRAELDERFNWNTICRSCLGRHWAKLNPEQQKEFMELFKKFLERTYLDQIEPYYNELDHID